MYEFRHVDGVSRIFNCNSNDQSLEKWICKHGTAFFESACKSKPGLLQMIKFLLDMNVILVRRDKLTSKSNNNEGNKLNTSNKIGLFGEFDYVCKNQENDYAMLKLILNHSTLAPPLHPRQAQFNTPARVKSYRKYVALISTIPHLMDMLNFLLKNICNNRRSGCQDAAPIT